MRKYGVVKINLSTPILFPSNRPWEGIKLDGLLGWIWAKDHGLTKTPAENNPENIQFPQLPLAELSPQLYAASTMFLPDETDFWSSQADENLPNRISCSPEIVVKTSRWTGYMKRPFQKDAKAFTPNISSGAYRAGMETYWALSTPYIYFYFATDDLDTLVKKYIERIPTDCFGIGAKTRSGYGKIVSVEYNELEEEDCFYYKTPNGFPTRPIPVDSPFHGKFPDNCIGYSSWRMPYFSASTKALCYLPCVSQYLPQVLNPESPVLAECLDIVAKQQQQIYKSIQEKKNKGKKKAAKPQ